MKRLLLTAICTVAISAATVMSPGAANAGGPPEPIVKVQTVCVTVSDPCSALCIFWCM